MEILKAEKKCAIICVLACIILLLQVTASACVVIPSEPLKVEADVGTIHFNGETADFYVLVSSEGIPMNVTLTAILYYDGAKYYNLTSLVQYVDSGLYRIP